MVYFAFLALLLVAAQTECYFVGDPGVFDQMIGKYGSGFGGMNNSGLEIYSLGHILTGVVAESSSLRVLDIVRLMMPSISDTLGLDGIDTDNPLNFKVANFSLNSLELTWSIGTREFPTVYIIEDFLTLSDVTVLVELGLNPDAHSLTEKFELRSLAMAGVWKIGSILLDFKIAKRADYLYIRGAPTSGELPVGDFIQLLGEALLPEEMEEPLRSAGLDRFTIQQARFISVFNDDGFALALSGNPTIEGWGSFRCHLMITRYSPSSYRKGRTAVTIAINLPSFSLAGLIRKLSGYDVTDIPVIGSLTIPETGLIISTGDLTPNLIPEVLDGPLIHVNPVMKGVTLVAAIPIVSGQPGVVFMLSLGPGGVRFAIADPGRSLTVGNLLSAIVPDFALSELEVPDPVANILQIILDIQLFGFSLATKPTKTFAVEFKLGRDLEVIPGIARIVDPSFYFNITFSKPRQKIVKFGGFWAFGSNDFPIQIEPAPLPPVLPGGRNPALRTARGFYLSGQGEDIRIGEVLQKFDADFLPEELSSILQSASMLDFAILRPAFKIPFGTGAAGFQMQLSGQPEINGWSGVVLNAVVNKGSGKAALAVGFEFANTGFAGLIEQMTGINVKALTLLDRSLKVAIIISSKTMEDVILEGDVLSRIPLRRGLSFIALFDFPADCAGDSFCDFAKGALGADVTLQISCTITSLTQFVIAAGVNNIQLGDGLILSEAALEFAIGTETYVGIRATLALTNPPLRFTGAVRLGIQGLELSMIMSGMWERAFGIDYLAFGNAIIAITLKPGVPVIGLELGGEIRVGEIGSGREIIVQVYLGIDPLMPKRNYFYGSVNKLTLGAVCEAFNIDISLPDCLANSGLPHGLQVSFSSETRELVPSGIVIPQGFVFNGTIDILGFQLKAYINIGIPRGISIDIRMTPLNIAGGLLKMYKSSTDKSSGPMLVADIRVLPSPLVNVTAQGYVSLFWGMFEREIFLQITNTHFIFWIRGRFFLFDALLKVYAPYGSLEEASFQVYGLLSTAWMDEIRKKALAVIDDGAKKATAEISKAQSKVRAAESKFDDAVAGLRSKRNNVNSLCRLRSCGSNCVGCPSWNGCCTRWWGSCIGCPSWNSCCWRCPDLICNAANFFCKGLRAVAYAALWLAEKFVDGMRWTLDVAIGALELVKFAVKIGAEAAKFIVNLTLGGIINIKKIEFDIKIGLVTEGHFKGSIVISFLGKHDVELSFSLRLKSIKDMALDLADAVFPGITGRGKREVRESLQRSLPGYSHRHYLAELYVYRPGSEAVALGRRPVRVPKIVRRHSVDDLLVKRETIKEEVRKDREQFSADISEFRNQVTSRIVELAVPEDAIETSEAAHVTTHAAIQEVLRMKDSALDTNKEKCDHFNKLQTFIFELSDVIDTVYDGWKLTVSNFSRTQSTIATGFYQIVEVEKTAVQSVQATKLQLQNVTTQMANITANLAEGNQTQYVEEAKQSENVTGHPFNLTDEDLTAFEGNMTEETLDKTMVYEMANDLDIWNQSSKDRLVEQNAAAIKKLLHDYDVRLKIDTGMQLPDFLSKLFEKLAVPYNEIVDDPDAEPARRADAVNLLESFQTIKDNMFKMIEKTVFQAKKISDVLHQELEEINSVVIFCMEAPELLESSRQKYTNVARGKTATQISDYSEGDCIAVASKAVDGNTDGTFSGVCSTSHTNIAAKPWWQVDLGQTYKIHAVFFFNRADCCKDRLTDFNVTIYDEFERTVKTIHEEEQNGRDLYGYKLEPAVYARRLKVQRNTDWGLLSIAEAEIYGEEYSGSNLRQSAQQKYTNVARGKTATQSSDYSHTCKPVASKAVDGSTDGTFSGVCSTTHTNWQSQAWWEVDLGATAEVHSVFLFNRADCCKERLSDFDVTLYDNLERTFSLHEPGGGDDSYSYPIEPPIYARRVKVQLRSSNMVLSLAEVEVYGKEMDSSTFHESAKKRFSNVALGMSTSQSSTQDHSCNPVAGKAVDGNTDGSFQDACTTTQTNTQSQPWWEVTLNQMTEVHSVFLYNRVDCCQDRLSDFDITFYDNQGSTVNTIYEAGGGANLFGYPIEPPIKAIKMRIQLRSSSMALSLAEVEIYGE